MHLASRIIQKRAHFSAKSTHLHSQCIYTRIFNAKHHNVYAIYAYTPHISQISSYEFSKECGRRIETLVYNYCSHIAHAVDWRKLEFIRFIRLRQSVAESKILSVITRSLPGRWVWRADVTALWFVFSCFPIGHDIVVRGWDRFWKHDP